MSRIKTALVAWLALACAPAAHALDFTLDSWGMTGSLRTQMSLGAAMRAQGRDPSLIGKLNLPGQEQACEDKDPDGPAGPKTAPSAGCVTVDGNKRFLALPGYPSVNFDNGDLNYDKGDLVAGAIKIAPRLQLTYGNFGLDVSGVYFYDAVNTGFTEHHPNNLADNNGFQPATTPRPKGIERALGNRLELLDAYVSGSVQPFGEAHPLSFKIGNQVLSIGTSTLLIFNSLNVVNPPDANVRFQPGSDVREVFRRVPLATGSVPFTEHLSVDTFYALGWKPVFTPPAGSFFAANDILGAEPAAAVIQFGKSREDPQNLVGVQRRTQGNASLISETGRTIYLKDPHEPANKGEYGVTVNYFAEQLNNTTFQLSYMNLHSRFPIISVIASAQSCTYNATDAATATADCQGFKTQATNGLEPFPLDTSGLVLDYPENIHVLGGSFSTNLGEVAWTGEVVYRPNQPLQVDPTDVGFAGFQPAFPAQSIVIAAVPNQSGGTTNVTIPGRRVAVPDYLMTTYRKQAVVPGQLISGYERFKTLAYNTSFLILKGASDNPFGADQMTSLLELGAFQVLDMPGVDELQLAAPGVFFHHSAGVDSTGTPNASQTAFPSQPQDRLNPSYQAGGFATPFSCGYRILAGLSYEEVFPGVKLSPQATFFHDVAGRSPQPTGEFLAGRKQVMVGLGVNYKTNWSGALRYNWFYGAGQSNLLSDRDNLALNISYDF